MVQAKKIGLLLILLFAALSASALSREDEIIAMKMEAHASLHTYKNTKEWCEKKYPATSEVAARVGGYVYPRINKVEGYLFSSDRNPEFRRFVEAKLKNAFAKGREQDIANLESKYTEQMCLNVLAHILKSGIGEELETYVGVER